MKTSSQKSVIRFIARSTEVTYIVREGTPEKKGFSHYMFGRGEKLVRTDSVSTFPSGA